MAQLIKSKSAIQDENALYYFRKEIDVNSLCESKINIFAESRYKLYINNHLIAVGPCRRASETGYYDTVDITDYLVEGENRIDVWVMQLSSRQQTDETFFSTGTYS